MGYVWDSGDHGKFSPDGKVADTFDADAHNAALEAAELAEWGTKPDRFCGYVSGGKLTTWRGIVLGDVVRSNSSRTGFYGSKITAYVIRGNNGACYHGRHGDMDFIRLRKMK